MSLNRIIILFVILLVLFAGFIFYQFNAKNFLGHSLPVKTVTIDNHSFSSEVATASADQQVGLSGRSSLPQDHGMLFLFPTSDRFGFWMKGMKFPLDIIYMQNGKIIDILQNVPAPKLATDNPQVYYPKAPADQVLEINAGVSKKDGFKEGDNAVIK